MTEVSKTDRHHILLLTGTPGIGKTTVIREVAARLGHAHLAGFYTQEIRSGGQRQGFRLLSFDGQERVMAHIDFSHTYRVGKYGVDVTAIDEAVETALQLHPDIDLYLIDEIGKMECLSDRFVMTMRILLDSPKPIVATIGKKGSGFIQEVKQRRDALLWEITHTNRDAMPDQVLNWLSQYPGSRF